MCCSGPQNNSYKVKVHTTLYTFNTSHSDICHVLMCENFAPILLYLQEISHYVTSLPNKEEFTYVF
jgi:hypothetical protein